MNVRQKRFREAFYIARDRLIDSDLPGLEMRLENQARSWLLGARHVKDGQAVAYLLARIAMYEAVRKSSPPRAERPPRRHS